MAEYTINHQEYSKTEYFSKIQRYSPSQRLLRCKRNVLLVGGFVLAFIALGIKVEGFSGGFIRGHIERPDLFIYILELVFLYHFYMFFVFLEKEKEKHILNTNKFHIYAGSIAKYIVKREIGKLVQESGLSVDQGDYEPKNFSMVGKQTEEEANVQFVLDAEFRNQLKDQISALKGFTLRSNDLRFSYSVSDKDKKFGSCCIPGSF